jgi:G patch domain and KOW motifs-containing protein
VTDLFQVSGIDCENARVLVAMTIDSEVVSVSQYAVKLVTKKEFDKFSKYLSEYCICVRSRG